MTLCRDCGCPLPEQARGRPRIVCQGCSENNRKARRLSRARERYATEPEYRAERKATSRRIYHERKAKGARHADA